MRHVPTAIYIDTEVFFRNGLNFNTNEISTIRNAFVKGGIRLLVPEMMERELLRHFKERAQTVAEKASNMHNEHPLCALEIPIPERRELENRCFEAFKNEWETFKSHFVVEKLPLVGNLEEIVDWYFQEAPPFAPGKKSKEFPDAFIFSALDAYNKQHSATIAIVSKDGDVIAAACSKRRGVSYFEGLHAYVKAFTPELTRGATSEPFDPLIPITTEDLNVLRATLGRGANVTTIELNRVLTLIAPRDSNHEYFFQNVTDPVWLEPLRERGYFSSPPQEERLNDGSLRIPRWGPIDYLLRVCEKAPSEVAEIIAQLPKVKNAYVTEKIVEIILKLDDPAVVTRFYDRIEIYLERRL